MRFQLSLFSHNLVVNCGCSVWNTLTHDVSFAGDFWHYALLCVSDEL